MAEIQFNGVWKRYPDGFEAVKDMNLDIHDGEFMILVGPSGCGKSTALRMIAGLEDITEGDLVIGGDIVNDLPPKDRDIAMVFQNYALYPHMTVRENMGFALRLAVMRAGVIQQVDTPARLYDDPVNLFVAGFIGSPSMNFLPGRLEGDSVRLPFGSARLSDTLRRRLEAAPGGHRGSMDVIVGIRPEQFEDASIESKPDSLRFRTKLDVVESMGSELFAYFDVQADGGGHEQLVELAKDAGMEELPSHGGGQQVVARLDAASRARAGEEIELALDTSSIKLFDPDGGRSLTATAAAAEPTPA
jgi:ABC-type sugar transport system ATPase subunit